MTYEGIKKLIVKAFSKLSYKKVFNNYICSMKYQKLSQLLSLDCILLFYKNYMVIGPRVSHSTLIT